MTATIQKSTVADRISAVIGSLTSAERRAARALLARYPIVGLESVTAFAEQANVSAPTVLRFIAKLGFDGYLGFRKALREELDESRNNPLTLPHTNIGGPDGGQSDALIEVLRATLAGLDRDTVERVVEILADDRRTVYILGGAFTASAASHLYFHLRKLRRHVFDLPQNIEARADRLADLGKRDIVILFDIRRYQPDVVASARLAAQRGCTIILFTDYWLSEAAEAATHVFRAKIDALSPWDSLLGIVAIVEIIAFELDHRLWSVVRPRLEAIETLRSELSRKTDA
jgi:DNA-binding MurR/RpiR family transcriptional regulator